MSRLKEIREKNKISQGQLAKEIGISVKSIQAYEQGLRDFTGAKLDTILKACVVLNCDLKEMFSDDVDIINLINVYEGQQ